MSPSPLLALTLPTTVPLQGFLAVAAVLFCTGVWGLINSRNAVRVLMSIELMLNGVNINLMAFSSYLDGQLIRGQVFTIFVIKIICVFPKIDSHYGCAQFEIDWIILVLCRLYS